MAHLGADDHVVRLRDGRSLGFAQYGDPDGVVVVNAHGGLVGRLDVSAARPFAEQAGVRLISPDRPGIGLSDRLPGRTLLDWADDISELLDQLGIERFSTMGWSMGGQYAATLGYAMPTRVRRVAIIAGALPLTEPGVFSQLPLFDRMYTRLSQGAPWVARQCFRTMALMARAAPTLNGRLATWGLGGADASVLRSEGFDSFSAMSYEGLRRPSGVVDDYRTWLLPWGFAPEDIDVPVDVWSGTEDPLVPSAWGDELAQRIPNATHCRRTGGHFVAHLHFAELLDTLTS
ncbi:alpha/beta fold hydrolase [Mycolicibacterium hodleri]|uniref:Alpha/beta hydrolase n=1 Tax=Mycolicibacterium hodleri TaxID=49897 RepID=A0A502EF59_9MYCO|nr:alpha/beta hydrolase [Mycolicibacterium hodleri]TPG36097.1 alpha/beta hydrolase [Mycolicibacterium hodleri]